MCVRLKAALVRAVDSVGALEAPVRARVEHGARRVTELGAELAGSALTRSSCAVRPPRPASASLRWTSSWPGSTRTATRRRGGWRPPGVRTADGDDRQGFTERAERLERRRETLGRVNPLAKEEYEAEKVRLEELSTQREDLERSLQELDRLRAELAETVETVSPRRSPPSRRASRGRADALPGRRGPAAADDPGGGRGRRAGDCRAPCGNLPVPPDPLRDQLRRRGALTPPASRSSYGPAGKKITRLSLLSGGEKALGAISFLFALFLARPCPFYLLDEVEAALDDTNIGRFVELLRRRRGRGAVRRHHAPEAHDGGGRRALRRDDGRRRRLADRLPPPAARGRARAGVGLTQALSRRPAELRAPRAAASARRAATSPAAARGHPPPRRAPAR